MTSTIFNASQLRVNARRMTAMRGRVGVVKRPILAGCRLNLSYLRHVSHLDLLLFVELPTMRLLNLFALGTRLPTIA
jgi:hypothetical protein